MGVWRLGRHQSCLMDEDTKLGKKVVGIIRAVLVTSSEYSHVLSAVEWFMVYAQLFILV